LKLLVVEPDDRLAWRLRHSLVERGHVVDLCEHGADGLHLALEGTYDVIILSDDLNCASEIELLRRIRARRATPVMLLGRADDPDERARALRMGADDYMVRPIAMSELLARVETLSRREGRRHPPTGRLTIADLEIDLVLRQVRREGRLLVLSTQEFRLLALLARHAGTVLSRTELREQLWDESCESDSNVVDVAIRRLRAKLDQPFAVQLIHTVRGVGYVMDESRSDSR